MATVGKKVRKKIDPQDYFSKINIPDDWSSLEEFVDWYLDSRMPLMIPWDAEVIVSDDAAAVSIFRKGNYQVEFYLEFPRMYIREHCHPRMEVIVMDLGGGKLAPKSHMNTSSLWGKIYETLKPGDYHGGETAGALGNGFITLAFQRWENPEEMTSAAVQWKGKIQGPRQAELIKRKKKNAIVEDNYADVTNDTSVSNG
jgi:hypothetical protein